MLRWRASIHRRCTTSTSTTSSASASVLVGTTGRHVHVHDTMMHMNLLPMTKMRASGGYVSRTMTMRSTSTTFNTNTNNNMMIMEELPSNMTIGRQQKRSLSSTNSNTATTEHEPIKSVRPTMTSIKDDKSNAKKVLAASLPSSYSPVCPTMLLLLLHCDSSVNLTDFITLFCCLITWLIARC
jgi:hypothetical protein